MLDKIISVILYLVVFLISCCFFRKASKYKTKGVNFVFFSVLGIIVFAVLAGLRSENIGTDVLVYAKPLYLSAMNSNGFFAYFSSHPTIEPLFLVLVFVSGKLFNSLGGVLFCVALLQIIPVYLVAVSMRDQIKIEYFMFLYYCLFSLLGFTTMRQMIAVSFLLLAYRRLSKNKYGVGLMLCIIALLFHTSSFIGLVFILLSLYINKNSSENKRKIISGIILIACVLVFINLSVITTLVLNKLGLNDRYSMYIDVFSGTTTRLNDYFFVENKFRGFLFLFFKLFLLLFVVIKKQLSVEDEERFPPKIVFWMVSILYVFFVVFLNTIYVERLTIYAEYYLLFYLSLCYKRNKISDSAYRVPVTNLLVTFIAICYFVVVYAFIGVSDAIPYSVF